MTSKVQTLRMMITDADKCRPIFMQILGRLNGSLPHSHPGEPRVHPSIWGRLCIKDAWCESRRRIQGGGPFIFDAPCWPWRCQPPPPHDADFAGLRVALVCWVIRLVSISFQSGHCFLRNVSGSRKRTVESRNLSVNKLWYHDDLMFGLCRLLEHPIQPN